jgi:hypothetical protein
MQTKDRALPNASPEAEGVDGRPLLGLVPDVRGSPAYLKATICITQF